MQIVNETKKYRNFADISDEINISDNYFDKTMNKLHSNGCVVERNPENYEKFLYYIDSPSSHYANVILPKQQYVVQICTSHSMLNVFNKQF